MVLARLRLKALRRKVQVARKRKVKLQKRAMEERKIQALKAKIRMEGKLAKRDMATLEKKQREFNMQKAKFQSKVGRLVKNAKVQGKQVSVELKDVAKVLKKARNLKF